MRIPTSRFLFSFAFVLLAACSPAPRPFTVSAAVNVQNAFTEIATLFEKQTGTRVTFNFGQTRQLAQQIAQGASVDLFVSADRASVDDLATRGLVFPETVHIYARGQIVLYTRADTPVPVNSLMDLARQEIKRVAIAIPEGAPYGRAAQEALQNAGLWVAVEPKLVFGQTVQQTQQYAESGNVDAAIVALSLAIGSKGRWVSIPQELYSPIDQALAVVKGAQYEREARAFAEFVTSPAARAVMVKFGYTFPSQ